MATPATKITVTLPDGTPLELPDGATGADAAAAIGPGLAKAALAISVDGELRDLAAPLPDGAEIAILTDRDPEALALIRHDAAHVMAEAVQELYPGTKVTIGPAIEDGFYYDFEFPEDVKITEADLGRDRGGDARPHRRRRGVLAARRPGRRGDRDLPRPGRGLQGRADRGPGRRRRGRDRLPLPQRPVRGPLPRPARPLDRADQGDQAELGRRRLLARRRDPPDADPDLRDRVLQRQGPRGPPRADRAGEGPRPPPPRPPARALHAPRGGAGDAVLAAERDDAAAADRGRGPEAAEEARLRGDQDAAGARRRALAPLGALGQLPREHVLHRVRRSPVRDPADELPRAPASSSAPSATPTASCRCGWPSSARSRAPSARASSTDCSGSAPSPRTTPTSTARRSRSSTR